MQHSEKHLRVTLWGVMGSVPGASQDMQSLGSNTSCMGITGQDYLFFDGGTGILRADLITSGPRVYHVFLSHYHYDHLMGLPFWRVLYSSNAKVYFYGPKLGAYGPKEAIEALMKPPFLPMGIQDFRADIEYLEVEDGKPIVLSQVHVLPIRASHPGGGCVYCIEGKNKGPKIGYLSDVDIYKSEGNKLESTFKNADFVYADTHFDLKTYEYFPDWGHSAIDHMLDFRQRAGIQLMALGHHAPDRTPEQLEGAMREALETYDDKSGVFLAKEGYSLELSW